MRPTWKWLGAWAVAGGFMLGAAARAEPADLAAEQARTPVNQVFQFMAQGTFDYAADSTVTATAYLWIPDRCRRIRGLLILGQNVTEHTLVGHPAIRAACAASDLGIVWSTPSFFSTKNKDPAKTIAFLQRLLNTLAAASGYEEVATAPWLPMGESGHLLMVDQLLDGAPERCIAGVYVKNDHYFCKNRETPILVAVGNAQEWGQDKIDIRTRWNDVSFLAGLLKERAAFPRWPVSLLIEGGSGHFDCTEAMARYFGAYLAAAVKARVPAEPGQPLVPVNLSAGFVAGLPVPGNPAVAPLAYSGATSAQRGQPWYFDEPLAKAAYAAAAINWQARSQMPAYLDPAGRPVLMTFNGVTNPVPSVTGADGVSFAIKVGLLPSIPPNFAAAGEPLARAPGQPVVEWICGPVAPLGDGRFRIALDRTWPKSPVCVAVREAGTADIRDAVQPGYLAIKPNVSGAPQAMSFDEIANVPASQGAIGLAAHADSGLPVEFFVVAGPAVVKGNTLSFTPIPPRTRLPVKITVTAWQWGRSAEPRVQTAATVTRSFFLGAPATLRRLLEGPPPAVRTYKNVAGAALHLAVFSPDRAAPGQRRAAVVWIHGGGWTGGTPDGFVPHARYFCSRGAVSFNLEYRLVRAGGPRIGDCIADCKSAIRYIRARADEFGIDPRRIAVAGDSAGGHLAAALATLEGFDDPADDRSVSAVPDAVLLFNPVLDLTEGDWIRSAVGGAAQFERGSPRPSSPEAVAAARALSPLFHVRPGQPPMLLMHGRDDVIVPWTQAKRMAEASKLCGNRCDFHPLEKTGHAFVVAYYKSPEAKVVDALDTADQFLASLGWLSGPPDLTVSAPPAWLPLAARPRG